MTNLTTTDLETVHGGCHTPCQPPPCHKPPCHKPPCHKPEHPRQPTHGGSPWGNWQGDAGNSWFQNPPWPTFPTYETAATTPATTAK